MKPIAVCLALPDIHLLLERVNGSSLDAFIARSPSTRAEQNLSDQTKLSVALQLSRAMSGVHDCGVLHRDLKPSNVMIDTYGHVRLIDFGLAIEARRVTERSSQAGTLAYAAPEILNRAMCSSSASDVYRCPFLSQPDRFSFGVLLWEFVSGFEAWGGFSCDELVRIAKNKGFQPFFDSSISEPMKALIRKCTAQSPSDRPTFKDVYRDLQRMGATMPQPRPPPMYETISMF